MYTVCVYPLRLRFLDAFCFYDIDLDGKTSVSAYFGVFLVESQATCLTIQCRRHVGCICSGLDVYEISFSVLLIYVCFK